MAKLSSDDLEDLEKHFESATAEEKLEMLLQIEEQGPGTEDPDATEDNNQGGTHPLDDDLDEL
jgi:hypothetical protein